MARLFLTNRVSASEAWMTCSLASKAGAVGVESMSGVKSAKNVCRDLQRQMKKDKSLPEPTFIWIPVKDKLSQDPVMALHPVLLPSQLIKWVLEKGAKLPDLQNLDFHPEMNSFRSKACQSLKIDPTTCIPLGLHGDGVPFQRGTHKNNSTEVFSWNFLCDNGGKRYMYCNINKDWLCGCGCSGRCTFDALLHAFVDDIHHLAKGKDKITGLQLPFTALVLQLRGDWAYFANVLDVPNWNSCSMCWMCRASKSGYLDYKYTKATAPWRMTKYLGNEFLEELASKGNNLSPLYLLPGFTMDMISVGVLHCLDLGVAQDILGNIFYDALHYLMEGNTAKDRVHQLFMRLKQFYKDYKIQNCLQALTLPMIRVAHKAPKLKAKGAETRALAPFGAMLARELDQLWKSTYSKLELQVALSLQQLYAVMRPGFWAFEVCSASSRELATSMTKLNKLHPECWQLKPKLHMVQELFEYQAKVLGNPRLFWEYDDESFLGTISKLAMRRGGCNSHSSTSLACMSRYRSLMSMGEV